MTDWEQRYAAVTQLFGDEPSELLVAERDLLKAGSRALAIGDGEGRNSVWLAEQGLHVTAVELSMTAQQRAAQLAARRNVSVEFVCCDFFEWAWPQAHYDVVTCIFVHLPAAQRHQLLELMWDASRPGGLILIEAYHRNQTGQSDFGPKDPAMLLDETELQNRFADAEILKLAPSTTRIVVDGQYRGLGDVIHFAARRPR